MRATKNKHSVRLDPSQVTALRRHGDGSVSHGIRRLVVDTLGVGTVDRPTGFQLPRVKKAAVKTLKKHAREKNSAE